MVGVTVLGFRGALGVSVSFFVGSHLSTFAVLWPWNVPHRHAGQIHPQLCDTVRLAHVLASSLMPLAMRPPSSAGTCTRAANPDHGRERRPPKGHQPGAAVGGILRIVDWTTTGASTHGHIAAHVERKKARIFVESVPLIHRGTHAQPRSPFAR